VDPPAARPRDAGFAASRVPAAAERRSAALLPARFPLLRSATVACGTFVIQTVWPLAWHTYKFETWLRRRGHYYKLVAAVIGAEP